MRPGGLSEIEEVPPFQQRLRRLGGEVQLPRLRAHLLDQIDRFRRGERRPTQRISRHHQRQVINRRRGQPTCESAHLRVAVLAPVSAVVDQMIDDERADEGDQIERSADARQERLGQRPPGGLVPRADPAQDIALHGADGGRRLAEIVGEDGEQQEAAARGRRLLPRLEPHQCVATQTRVFEGIALGVPLRFLEAAAEGGDLGKVPQPAGLLEDDEAARRPHGLRGPLVPFVPDPLHGELRVGVDDGTAQRGGFRGEREIEAGGELHPAQHPERILYEGRAGVAQHAGLEIGDAVERIDQTLGERIPRDRVEREVAPRRGVRVAQRWVGCDGEAAVAGAGLGFAARQAEVVFPAVPRPHLDHPKTASDHIGGAERGEGLVKGGEVDAPHFHVEILRGDPHEPVPHAAAHQARPADGPEGEEGFAEGVGQQHGTKQCGSLRLVDGARRTRRESSLRSAGPRRLA